MYTVLVPESKTRKEKRQIWGSRNWQERGEGEEANPLLTMGLPAALFK